MTSNALARSAAIYQALQHGASCVPAVLDAIIQEVATLVDVSQHPNIVRFIGEEACILSTPWSVTKQCEL
jgi:hypothetical protein